jgi:hypothetical protein
VKLCHGYLLDKVEVASIGVRIFHLNRVRISNENSSLLNFK